MTPIAFSDTYDLLGQVNLNHLLYFWAVGKSRSISVAARRLKISQPSVSERIRILETRLGAKLLERRPRGVTLTGEGEAAMRFAEELVGVCSELVRAIPLDAVAAKRPLVAGTADAVPKIVVRSILEPLLAGENAPRLVCREWRVDQLLAELSLQRIDLVISDSPRVPRDLTGIRCDPAASSPVTFCAAPALARKLKRGFPGSLDGAPMLLPAEGAAVRPALDRYFALHRVTPRIVLEAEDRSLLHHFAEEGHGIVPVAASIAPRLCEQFGLTRLATLRDVHEQYYVITTARGHEHPAIELVRDRLRSGRRSSRAVRKA